MSVVAARTRAEEIIAQLGIVRAPVNVEAVAEKLGLRVVTTELGADVSGLLVSQKDDVSIVVNKDDHQHRQRFTIAHEIGHFALRHQFEDGGRVHVDRGAAVSYRGPRAGLGIDRQEIEANQFAACLLMPAALVRAVAVGRTLSDRDVERLAVEFDVSEQAMTFRLTALRLL